MRGKEIQRRLIYEYRCVERPKTKTEDSRGVDSSVLVFSLRVFDMLGHCWSYVIPPGMERFVKQR